MSNSGQCNFIFVVLDACRLDYAREHAPFLTSLADDNLAFENAIAPSTWSPPSHASTFTGEYPHEHDVYRVNDSLESVRLFPAMRERGYTCYGVSGNGFLSQSTGLHGLLDGLDYTSGQGPFLEGLTVYEHVFADVTRGESVSGVTAALDTVSATLRHEHPVKSALNLGAVGLNRISATVPPLQHLPHPVFNPFQPYSYSPEKNTRLIASFLSDYERTDGPFFLFANYMDTHRPYDPPKRVQREQFGEPLPYSELRRINDEVGDPWKFAELEAAGEVDHDDLETMRSLYAGAVTSVDEHLERIFGELSRRDLEDETIVVVTADHGENLGEVDDAGHRRVGHHSSTSERLTRVPLVVAHPALSGRNVSEHVSLKDLFGFFTGGHEEVLASSGSTVDCLVPDDDVVLCEYPATGGGEELFQKYPNAPEDAIEHRVSHHSVAGYLDEWKLVVETTGRTWATRDGDPTDVTAVPDALLERCEKHLNRLRGRRTTTQLSDDEVDHLETLGYL